MRTGVVAVLLTVLALACGSKGGSASGKPRVAVSIFPIYDLARRVAGDRLEVMLVLPPGQSEHSYDPTPKDIAALDGAKLGIVVGLEMDRWAANVMKSAGAPPLLAIGEQVPTIPIDVEPISEEEAHEHEGKHEEHDDHAEHDEHGHAGVGTPDPHVWMDPDRMRRAVDAIAARFTELDPAGKDTYAKNAAAVKQSLADLDARLAARRKTWTKSTIVTFHGSMAYFAKRYAIRIAAVVEPIAGTEPTPTYLMEVVGAVKRGKAVALFTEPQLAKGPGEAIAKEAGIPLGELDPVGGVAGRDSYEALLTWNADQLEKVLR